MAQPAHSSTPAGNNALPGHLRRNWGWLLALGVLMMALGVVGLGMLVTLTIVTAIWFGVLLLIAGGAQVVDAFRERTWGSFALHLLMALLYIAAGALVIYDPVLASISLTLLVAAMFVAIGVVRMGMAFQARPARSWWLLLISGIISIALGLMIFAGWPASGFWVLGLLFAIELIVQGASCIGLALGARKGWVDSGVGPGAALAPSKIVT